MNGLSEDVRRFLARHIDSVKELEVLLHARQSPRRSWSAADMARELYSHPTSIEQRFQRRWVPGSWARAGPGAGKGSISRVILSAAKEP